jgi:hypothetical protein
MGRGARFRRLRGAEHSLTESAFFPFQAEPTDFEKNRGDFSDDEIGTLTFRF